MLLPFPFSKKLSCSPAPQQGDSLPIPSYKALIPLSKLKALEDESDLQNLVDFKCDTCANCPNCKASARLRTKSVQEEFEQSIIQKSVRVDLEKEKVFVDLPFIKDPINFLTDFHKAPSNYKQALKFFHVQCRKGKDVKEQLRLVHKDLVDKGFMSKLSDLPSELQKEINTAPFRHFYPWRSVLKADSLTTPVRIVVNPTITGLNLILAKGVNMIGKIPEVLTRFRIGKFAWGSDVSKLYNQLFLNPKSLCYSLFLFNDSLDVSIPPTVWVMTRAWYGVSSTGNQAGVALEMLANQFRTELPLALAPLTDNRYVDDILGQCSSLAERDEQISQTQQCLAKGGFKLKFVAKSGSPPPPNASSDGETVGCLGLKWNTLADTLSPGFKADFSLSSTKLPKEALSLNLAESENLRKALKEGWFDKTSLYSRVLSFYDPCGFWSPITVQLKLKMQHLNGMGWHDPIPPEHHEEWIKLFQLMVNASALSLPQIGRAHV